MTDLPILERRRIEAQILRHVHEVLTERHGRAEADAVIGGAVSRSAIEQGREFAARLDHVPDLGDFAAIQHLWTAGGALEIEPIEQTDARMAFDVTRCRYAEMYREMGLGEIGHLLSCARDGDFCVGFNPEMQLERGGTIMGGAERCDFRYSLPGKG